jgi:hypothetical protein
MEDVVSQHQRARAAADELAPDDEGLRQALGPRLHRVRNLDAPVAPVPRSSRNRGVSCGVEITRISRMPASISVVSG